MNLLRPLLLYGALIGALLLGYQTFVDRQQAIGEQRATDRYDTALAKQKAEAAGLLATETARALAAERQARELRDQQEKTDAKHLKTVAVLQDRLLALSGPDGRLRDPHAQPGRGGSGGGAEGPATTGAADRPGDGAQAGGLLSAELSGLLRSRLIEADTINAAYTSCRADLLRRVAGGP